MSCFTANPLMAVLTAFLHLEIILNNIDFHSRILIKKKEICIHSDILFVFIQRIHKSIFYELVYHSPLSATIVHKKILIEKKLVFSFLLIFFIEKKFKIAKNFFFSH
jgi:hypothetical protein